MARKREKQRLTIMFLKNTTFFGPFPDGEQFREPTGRVGASAAAAIANIKQPTNRTDPRGSNGAAYNEKEMGPVCSSTHPEYNQDLQNWTKWRNIYEGGEKFITQHLQKFSNRENPADYLQRQQYAPTPTFAKSGINEIKNSIFQRIADVTRQGGPQTYQEACKGNLGGVNRQGGSMNWFIGDQIIAELLVMRKIGVFVDMPTLPQNASLSEKGQKHPYLYTYKAEDIRNWDYYYQDHTKIYTKLLLRDYVYVNDGFGLPNKQIERYRLLRLATNNKVIVQFFDNYGNPIDTDGKRTVQIYELNLNAIPFVEFSISDSLMKDVANHQIALLNMSSSDVDYLLKAGFAFYTEQRDTRTNNQYLKGALQKGPTDPTSVQPPIPPVQGDTPDIQVGAAQGRSYPQGLDRPGFIHPSSEPIVASMKKQDQLERQLRALLYLTLNSVTGPKQQSAESKAADQLGLESGLSYIGLELENGEKQIGTYWSKWEGEKTAPIISYPKKWRLQSDDEARAEAKELAALKVEVPSATYQRKINKLIAERLVGCHVDEVTLKGIQTEIDSAPGTTSNPEKIASDIEHGILSLETASLLSGYDKTEATKAAKDHADRLARIAESQAEASAMENADARGIQDQSANPQGAKQEKQQSRDTTTNDSTASKVRGKGK